MDFTERQWDSYTEKLRDGCERLGVPFGVLGAGELEGWAFVDRAHMTDEGQRQAAGRLLEMMGVGAA